MLIWEYLIAEKNESINSVLETHSYCCHAQDPSLIADPAIGF